jgi:hypothetical protein
MSEATILTLVRGEPLKADEISVIRPATEAIEAVIKRAEAITEVTDSKSQAKASLVAQELQGLRSGLEANYRAAKQPLISTGRALDGLYKELDEPLLEQYRRMDALVSAFQDRENQKAEMAEIKIKAEQRVAEERAKEKIRELERQKQELEFKLKQADDAREKRQATQGLNKVSTQIEAEKIGLEIAKENIPVQTTPVPVAPKPPGGRPWTQYHCELLDPIALYNVHPELLKIELRQAGAQALAKSLDEGGKPLQVPGLSIRKETRTSFPGAAAIRIHGDDEQ